MIVTLMACTVTGVCCLSGGVFIGTWWATRGRDEYVDRLKRRIEQLKVVNSAMYQELTALVAERKRRLAPLIAANAARKAAARSLKDANHAAMREALAAPSAEAA